MNISEDIKKIEDAIEQKKWTLQFYKLEMNSLYGLRTTTNINYDDIFILKNEIKVLEKQVLRLKKLNNII